MKKKQWLYRNWWWCIGIPFLFIFPFILNFILLVEKPSKVEIIGNEKDWLIFWATYITGAATLIIIYFNMRYHRELKTLQINTLKYTQKQKWLELFREALQKNIAYLNIATLKNAILRRKDNPLSASDVFDDLFRETTTIPNQFTLLFNSQTDTKEEEYLNLFRELSKRYADMILLNIRIILLYKCGNDLKKCHHYLMNTGIGDKISGITMFTPEEYKELLKQPDRDSLFKTVEALHDKYMLSFLTYYQTALVELIKGSHTLLLHEECKIDNLLSVD